MFTRKYVLGILLVSLLGSVTLAYGLSTEFLFKFDSGVNPTGVASNSTHIFVANNTKIEIFDLSGNSVDSFTPANDPYDVAVNSTHIFVTTDNDGEIRLFNLSGDEVLPILNVGFTSPFGITVNSTHIFVVDGATNRVEILNLSGSIVDTLLDTGSGGELGDPTDVAIDSNGRILVTDNADDRIEIFDSSGNYLTFIGSSGSGDGQFSNPFSIDVDSNNRIIVADAANRDVQIFDSSGNFLTTFGTFGTGDGQFISPSGLTVDSNDRIIVADLVNNNVQVFAYVSESSTVGGGGNDNKHRTSPTSGLDWTTHKQIVTDGFRINDFKVTLDNNWWTDFPEKQIIVGIPNEFEIKTYAQNGGLMIQELCFGLDEVGLINTAEVCLEAWYDYQQNIVDVKVIQDTNVINEDLLKVSTSEEYCDIDGMKCTVTLFYDVVFMEHLKNKVMAIQSIDQSRRTMMPTSLNDGIVILGEPLNPMLTRQIAGIEKGEGLITITQVEKYSDLWVTDDGRIFERYGESDSFRLTNIETKRITDTGHVNSRSHSAWDMLIEHQNEIAKKYFDSSKIQNPDKGFVPSN